MNAFRRSYHRFTDILDKAALAVASASITAATIVITLQVCMRYFFHNSLTWAEELPRYLMVCGIFIGASCVARRKNMISITAIVTRLQPKVRRRVDILANICSLIFLVALTYYGIKHALSPAIISQLSPAMHISMSIPYSLVPMGSLLLIFQFIDDLINPAPLVKEERKEWLGG